MTLYDAAPEAAEKMLLDLIDTCEELAPLKECGATVELSWARGKPKKDGSVPDAIKWRGNKALGLASKFDLQERIHGKKDCRITIDADFWDGATEQKQRALLFHELYHFEPQYDDAGEIRHDDAGRPAIKLRRHDLEVGWFWATARRFGADAQESIQFKQIVDSAGQILLPGIFGDKDENSEERGSIDFSKATRQIAQRLQLPESAAHRHGW